MKASERLARRVARRVLQREVAPGTALPNESEMAFEFNAGRSTTREALRLLEAWGVAIVVPGRNGGAFAKRPGPSDLGKGLGVLMQFEGATLGEIFGARRLLDAATVSDAVRHITDDDVARLRECLTAMHASRLNRVAFNLASNEFFTVLVGASENRAVRVILLTLKSVTDQRMREFDFGVALSDCILEHREALYARIVARDAAGAEQSMFRYRDMLLRYWGEHYPGVLAAPVDVFQLDSSGPSPGERVKAR